MIRIIYASEITLETPCFTNVEMNPKRNKQLPVLKEGFTVLLSHTDVHSHTNIHTHKHARRHAPEICTITYIRRNKQYRYARTHARTHAYKSKRTHAGTHIDTDTHAQRK